MPLQRWSPAKGYAGTTNMVLDFPGIGNLTATAQPDGSLRWSNGVHWQKTPVIRLPAAGPVRCEDVGELSMQCLGIRFGRTERWRRSTTAEPWTKTRDATQYGPICAQGTCVTSGSAMRQGCAEDCLFFTGLRGRSVSSAWANIDRAVKRVWAAHPLESGLDRPGV